MNVPIYVYILFIALVYMGIARGFPRTVQLRRLFIAPLVFIALSIRGMVVLFDFQQTHFLLWMCGCVLGICLGHMHVRNRQIKADHDQQLIQLPGDWSLLGLILAIFSFEFFIHYSIDAQWGIASTSLFKFISIMILGTIAGMSTGRTIHYLIKYYSSASQPLVLKNQ